MKEKWDLPESPVEHRANETSAVEVKFGGTAASFFEHLRLAPSGEIPVHDTSWRSRRVAGGFRSELPEDVGDHRNFLRAVWSEIRDAGGRILRDWLNCCHFLIAFQARYLQESPIACQAFEAVLIC
jgi:hypothetical protein